MYLTTFRASEAALVLLVGCCGDEAALQKAVNTLAAAQQRCEDLYVESETEDAHASSVFVKKWGIGGRFVGEGLCPAHTIYGNAINRSSVGADDSVGPLSFRASDRRHWRGNP